MTDVGDRLTVDRQRQLLAGAVPHVERRSPWVASSELRRILRDAPADAGLLDDLADVRGALVEGE